MIDFKTTNFDLSFNFMPSQKVEIESKYPLEKIDSLILNWQQ